MSRAWGTLLPEDFVPGRMDLSHDDAIDTACRGCGGSAEGWAFAGDGRRVYVCADCAQSLHRYTPEGNVGVAPHPRAQFCRVCDRLTLNDHLNHQLRCPDCEGAAGDRAEAESPAGAAPEDTPPEVAVAQADAEGAIDWDEDEDG
ncbi:hypothetical protein M197_gp30 [Haloarcula hispanica tailed virus 2]|uniref:Uncharacterized protein n=1 Tax=Haloarcula hispanica tailed virus 2 TaxID=1273751 RepID=R4T8I7_9CAUD|nr:hypothetical protein M197_gp30 [Haloarcula hispanica tailed virus 2]AGM11195.1 hypothetical protein HHTV2_30 [Haloarcula hispanica tailed virus 2]